MKELVDEKAGSEKIKSRILKFASIITRSTMVNGKQKTIRVNEGLDRTDGTIFEHRCALRKNKEKVKTGNLARKLIEYRIKLRSVFFHNEKANLRDKKAPDETQLFCHICRFITPLGRMDPLNKNSLISTVPQKGE